MTDLTVTGIGLLATQDPDRGDIAHAAVVIAGGVVTWVGEEAALPAGAPGPRWDAAGRCALPGFVDAHTHLLFAGDRSEEFAARMAGLAYDAGGIRETVAATRAAPDAALSARARRLAAEALRSGTTACEIKSGYGLTVGDEQRCLQIAEHVPGCVARTFLGAHVVPPEHDLASYVAVVTGEMLDTCAPLADWIDCFCEDGAFDLNATRAVLAAGAAHGLGLRLHTNQLRRSDGVLLAAELGVTSVDHCTHLSDRDVTAIRDAGMVATLVPGAEFSTRSPYAPARRLLDAGATVALATDCNPGTSYTTSMPFVIALAVRELGMTPSEAVTAATRGGAASLARDDLGRVAPGCRGDLLLLDAPSPVHLAYRPGVDLVDTVIRAGAVVHTRQAA